MPVENPQCTKSSFSAAFACAGTRSNGLGSFGCWQFAHLPALSGSHGSMQPILNDPSIDPTGDVWIANNWNNIEAAAAENPLFNISTWGGGSGISVLYCCMVWLA